ncbi:MAG: hypothetical protein EOO61_14910 [Hymenobacter sp.]|nr:MAG: hypothetical protein EOO61_14910 [Hymenobacter sp.]
MLPIYQATAYMGVLPGGSTKPWAVYVLGEAGLPVPFVVKTFRDEPLKPQPYVANEVFGSVLAGLFDLPVPKAAFIEFTQDFLNTLGPQQLSQLGKSEPGLKFGCEYIETPFQYSPSLARRVIAGYDIETIYAFDNLILNRDRRLIKPNLLLLPQEAYLIDHELTMLGSDLAKSMLGEGKWIYLYKQHLFYKYLKSRGIEAASRSFQSFGGYLQEVNFDELVPYYHQLVELGFDTSHFDSLYQYLCYQNANSDQFEEILRRTLL